VPGAQLAERRLDLRRGRPAKASTLTPVISHSERATTGSGVVSSGPACQPSFPLEGDGNCRRCKVWEDHAVHVRRLGVDIGCAGFAGGIGLIVAVADPAGELGGALGSAEWLSNTCPGRGPAAERLGSWRRICRDRRFQERNIAPLNLFTGGDHFYDKDPLAVDHVEPETRSICGGYRV